MRRIRGVGLGEAMASSIIDWQAWCHRKVESLNLMEGDRARRRVSLDCTPQDIGWPVYDWPKWWAHRRDAQIAVPLTMMSKGLIRDLDVSDSEGRPISVLGRSENVAIAELTMWAMVKKSVIPGLEQEVRAILSDIAGMESKRAQAKAEGLIVMLKLSDSVANRILDFAANFLLVALLPREKANQRQLIKYSYHWERESPGTIRSALRGLVAGLGFISYKSVMEIAFAQSARSYHLEVPAPDGLLVTKIRLGKGSDGLLKPSRPSVVGHAQANYSKLDDGTDDAEIFIRLARRSILPPVAGAALLVWLGFSWALIAPNALSSMRSSADAATALLLVGPALMIGWLARNGENAITSRLLGPTRFIAGSLSLLLVSVGLGLVFRMPELALYRLLTLGSIASFAVGVVLTAGSLTTWIRSNRQL